MVLSELVVMVRREQTDGGGFGRGAVQGVQELVERVELPRRDTGPVPALRSLPFASGERFRVNFPVPGMPRRTIDVVFPRRRVAVFVGGGCLWHSCPDHGTAPRRGGRPSSTGTNDETSRRPTTSSRPAGRSYAYGNMRRPRR